ncbi:Sip1-related alpha-galactosidase [Opitutus sp. ER46]|uniref:Sip1-related alpha-galactosidase n=1 Tax=Opitutus sp. ER46 TaxID=2161864 RepID=UPI000D321944|nr:Sip1-related alpha-galactosidase [Opitutus sp. ER46]PTX98528.1 hypothetical protein DB354_04495 [Opitutus sp. ER46]
MLELSNVPPPSAQVDVPLGTLDGGILQLEHTRVLAQVPPTFAVEPDPLGVGVFLQVTWPAPRATLECPLGQLVGLQRFTSGARNAPFWVAPVVGTATSQVQRETLWVLAQVGPQRFVLVVPLLGPTTRYSLAGDETGLRLVADTGDEAVPVDHGTAVFIAMGRDPYALTAAAARAVTHRLGAGRLRLEKPLPDFIDDFGWCTWDAFYQDVSSEKVLAGLASFAAGGVQPRFLLLDDGWQTVAKPPEGAERLSGFASNDRFPEGLAALVNATKTRFGIKRLLVWHALLGYWGGVADAALPGYGTRDVTRSFPAGVPRTKHDWDVAPWGATAGVPAASEIGRFFDDYHRSIAAQGVDGVKVDNQATLEAVSTGQGGRVVLARAYREGLERSVHTHFDGRLINCMSVTSEGVYLMRHSVLMRTSDDFWPQRPDAHGHHLFTNAQVALWFGEFVLPDWDMFQSGHPAGAYHAAARAVAGGPIYVSDKPGAHDFELLRKLVLSDGSVLRPDSIARPSPDCLFADPTREPVLLKVFNTNRDCGVVGVFNAQYHASGTRPPITGTVGIADVPTLAAGPCAAFVHRANRVCRIDSADSIPVALAEGEWELVSLAPVENAFAALGLADKLNSTGAIVRREWRGATEVRVQLREGGRFLGWSAQEPAAVFCDGRPVSWQHGAAGRLEIALPCGGPRTLILQWR